MERNTKPVQEKLAALRALMRREGIDAFITPSTDPHSGEYIPDRWKSREWISGFDGSAGIAVVTADKAALWTDSRYFIAAAEQIEGTDFVLMKEKIEGTPTQAQWLAEVLLPNANGKKPVVAIDGWVNTAAETQALKEELMEYGIDLRADIDPYAEIWTDRPGIPDNKVFIQTMDFAGESAASKIARIRKELKGNALLVSMLEEVGWTLNLRCSDVEYTPFLVSYMLITPDTATLYIKEEKLTDEVVEYLKGEGVDVKPYEAIADDVAACPMPVYANPNATNYAVYSQIKTPLPKTSPIAQMLIYKNETEIRGFRSAMEKDGVAMVKWIKWALENIPKGDQTELSLAAKLESFRAEQEHFKGISFGSIMGYGPHGAIVHYHPCEETDVPVKPEGLLLIDSGGQYLDGTTDITRTIPLGPLTYEMRRDYTLVLRGWARLSSAVFPRGINGTNLDGLARDAMWRYGINYLHGTGHGVGSFMSVHESVDLHQFRMQWRPTPLLPGMVITCEPAIYIEGSHGVRHENTMLVVESNVPTITYGPYYAFEALTLCPVLTSPIIVDMLDREEKEWFNNYQQMVYDRLAPRLDEEHKQWLYEVTRPI